MRSAVLVVSLISMLLLSCSKSEGEACTPGECRKDLVCEGAKCLACAETAGCAQNGDCSWDDEADRCAPSSDSDCARSEACKKRRECYRSATTCIDFDPHGDHKEGGCPCGCDRSEELVSELRTQDRDEALVNARRSLATIGEREQLGYVTEAMVEHRLRLRALESELLAPGEEPASLALAPRALELRAERAAMAPRVEGGLAVRAELLVFGATTEIVRGKSKDLRASFRLWLGLTNVGSVGRTLRMPRLEGRPGATFDVRRWYVEDGDGAPWDGTLGPGEEKSILLVGYLLEDVSPGAPVTARYVVGDIDISETRIALGRWDAHAGSIPEHR